MIKFLLKKLSIVFITLLGVSLISFLLIRMVPGDPVLLMLGERGGNPELYQQMQQKLGLDKPLYEQYGIFLLKALQGNLGESIHTNRPIFEEFFSRFPATLELGVVALFWATLLGIPLGVLAAVKRNTIFDYSLMGVSLVGYSMPIFWWALILILIFSVQLGLTPVSGRISVFYEVDNITGLYLIDSWFGYDGGFEAFKSALSHLILPAFALGTIPLAVIARMTRSSMLEVLGENYIRTAKSKGLSSTKVVFVHALRNALIPVVTVVGLLFGSLITGAILTETMFSWPGIGKWLVQSVSARDYPAVQGGILLIAFLVVMTNMLIDLLYILINPKMRKGA